MKELYTLTELANYFGISRQRLHKVLVDKNLITECEQVGRRGARAYMLLVPASVALQLPWAVRKGEEAS